MIAKEEAIYQRERVLALIKKTVKDISEQRPNLSPGEIRKMLEYNVDFPTDVSEEEWTKILGSVRNKQINPTMRGVVNTIRLVI